MFTYQSCAVTAQQLGPGGMTIRPRTFKGPPLPPGYFGRRRRVTSAVSGLLRILLALGTIPLALESVRVGNYPGDGNHQYIAFYWTEALMMISGLFGIIAGWKVNHFNLKLHSQGSLVIGCLVPITQLVMGIMGCIHDGHGVNPTPSYYERRGKFVQRYAGNNADPIYSRLLVAVAVVQMVLCFLGCYIHHQSWETRKKRRNYVQEDEVCRDHPSLEERQELRSHSPRPSLSATPIAQHGPHLPGPTPSTSPRPTPSPQPGHSPNVSPFYDHAVDRSTLAA